MESSDWLALAGIASTLFIAVINALLNERRERRQERIKLDEQERAHKFNIRAKQLELQYGRLHEKRVEAMADLFRQLESIRGSIDLIAFLGIEDGKDETENIKKILKELNGSISLFNKNKLYFSKELAGKIDQTIDILLEISTFARQYIESPQDVANWQPALHKWFSRNGEIQATLDQIEMEFRSIIGTKT